MSLCEYVVLENIRYIHMMHIESYTFIYGQSLNLNMFLVLEWRFLGLKKCWTVQIACNISLSYV